MGFVQILASPALLLLVLAVASAVGLAHRPSDICCSTLPALVAVVTMALLAGGPPADVLTSSDAPTFQQPANDPQKSISALVLETPSCAAAVSAIVAVRPNRYKGTRHAGAESLAAVAATAEEGANSAVSFADQDVVLRTVAAAAAVNSTSAAMTKMPSAAVTVAATAEEGADSAVSFADKVVVLRAVAVLTTAVDAAHSAIAHTGNSTAVQMVASLCSRLVADAPYSAADQKPGLAASAYLGGSRAASLAAAAQDRRSADARASAAETSQRTTYPKVALLLVGTLLLAAASAARGLEISAASQMRSGEGLAPLTPSHALRWRGERSGLPPCDRP